MLMSLKNPKNLLIIGAVVIALLAGTVLLANYANILPARSGAGSQAKTCPAAGGTTCPMAKAVFAENAEVTSIAKIAVARRSAVQTSVVNAVAQRSAHLTVPSRAVPEKLHLAVAQCPVRLRLLILVVAQKQAPRPNRDLLAHTIPGYPKNRNCCPYRAKGLFQTKAGSLWPAFFVRLPY